MKRRRIKISRHRSGNAPGPAQPATRGHSPGQNRRRAAEWTTLGLSLAIVLGLGGYLIYEGVIPDPPYIPVRTTILTKQVRQLGNRYLLPVEVSNPGRKTLTNVMLEVRSPSGEIEAEIALDYLGRHSKQTIYAFVEQDPRQRPVEVAPRIYTLD